MSEPKDRWHGEWKYPRMTHGKFTSWNWVAYYPKRLNLGYGVDIGFGTLLQAEEGILVGDNTQIGGGCLLYTVCTQTGRRAPIVIGARCRIGSHSLLLPGVRLGDDVCVGAHSILGYYVSVPSKTVLPAQTLLRRRGP